MAFELPPLGFAEKPSDTYRCPNCRTGLLEVVDDSFAFVEPKHSKAAQKFEEWEPDWIEYRFSFRLQCNAKACQELAFAIGTGSLDQRYDGRGGAEYYDSFRIHAISPPPDIFAVPEDTPIKVEREVKRSFSLYWVDLSAASNALRTALERLLDEMGIPASEKKASGGTRQLTLHGRIENASAQNEDFAELFMALKEVGNLGSHGDQVRRSEFEAATEIFAHVLKELFQNDSARIKKIAKSLRDRIKSRRK